ncbi:hypothetical protein [Paraburkholderia ribeironis]|nr:hypothetical protein [Paraburkholderia ribeironis]
MTRLKSGAWTLPMIDAASASRDAYYSRADLARRGPLDSVQIWA